MEEWVPIRLERTGDRELVIEWSDGVHQRIAIRALRKACPCATCLEKAKAKQTVVESGQLPILPVADTMPLEITAMEPAGNYGYKIRFGDGHSSGIFSLEILRSLC